MKKIDAHHHFWKFSPLRDSWITDEMKSIQKDFLPEDFKTVLQENNVEGAVVVQSNQSEAETEILLHYAEQFDFIKGIVGWVDLQAENVADRLQYYSRFKKLKGFRHVLQGEAQRDLMLRPAFMKGISLLHQFNFTYDILIFPDQLQFVPELVSAFPQQLFVIDHIAKPNIKEHQIEQWTKEIKALAPFENLYCKISGMVTEADWHHWKTEDFKPYMDVVVKTFGPDRIMFGSDWPVCLLAASYEKVMAIADDYFDDDAPANRENFFALNATRFYNL